MNVFISWSGDLSREIGQALRDWLPGVLQAVRPYFTPDDIEKGARWTTEISKELETTDQGIICTTLENFQSPWIMFEAGALSKRLDTSRVCPILFDLTPADLKGPLIQFQCAKFNEEEMRRLILGMNALCGEHKLPENVIGMVFTKWWPDLESKVNGILQTRTHKSKGDTRKERDILEEILELTRVTVRRVSPSRDSADLPDFMEMRHHYDGLRLALAKGDIVRVEEMTERLGQALMRRGRTSRMRPPIDTTHVTGVPPVVDIPPTSTDPSLDV